MNNINEQINQLVSNITGAPSNAPILLDGLKAFIEAIGEKDKISEDCNNINKLLDIIVETLPIKIQTGMDPDHDKPDWTDLDG